MVFFCGSSVFPQELLGVSKALMNTRSSMGKHHQNASWVGLMKMVVRLDMTKKFPDIVAALLNAFDNALLEQFCRLRQNSVSAMAWLQIHRPIANLLMAPDGLDAVVDAKGSWNSVAPQVARLTAGTRTGEAVFKFAADVLLADSYREQIDRGFDNVLKKGSTASAIADMKKTCEEKIQLLQGRASMQSKREIQEIG